ncbi:unnamed protein product [Gulo gulo]|uniref:Uncharacterized protein n=1 Tax=Gulo gulo TaxID=48420 RepID=A0A9X9Q0C3_GULGU|nr:unnamed protein product [Gulo gulo]
MPGSCGRPADAGIENKSCSCCMRRSHRHGGETPALPSCSWHPLQPAAPTSSCSRLLPPPS